MWPWALASLGVHATVLVGLLLVWPAGGPKSGSTSDGVEVELLPAVMTPAAQEEKPVAAVSQQALQQSPAPVEQASKPSETKAEHAPEKPDTRLALNKSYDIKENKNSKLYNHVKESDEYVPQPVPDTQAPVVQDGAQARAQAIAQAEAARNRAVRQRLEKFKRYPASARRRGIEGAVDVSFRLNAEGRAENMQLVSGSGYEILDEAALDTVRRAQPFPVHGGLYRFRLHFRRS